MNYVKVPSPETNNIYECIITKILNNYEYAFNKMSEYVSKINEKQIILNVTEDINEQTLKNNLFTNKY